MDGLVAVTVAATALSGVLAGASLDQSVKQLPARRRIGAAAYAAYSRASDLGHGVAWYAGIGIGAALLTIVAAAWAFARGRSLARALPLYGAALLSLLHPLVTSRAAPHAVQPAPPRRRGRARHGVRPLRAMADAARRPADPRLRGHALGRGRHRRLIC